MVVNTPTVMYVADLRCIGLNTCPDSGEDTPGSWSLQVARPNDHGGKASPRGTKRYVVRLGQQRLATKRKGPRDIPFYSSLSASCRPSLLPMLCSILQNPVQYPTTNGPRPHSSPPASRHHDKMDILHDTGSIAAS